MGIKLVIEDPESCIETMRELKRAGLLKDIPNEIMLDEDMFPVEIPVDVGKVLKKIENPVIRKVFGKQMDTAISMAIVSLTGTPA